MTTKPIGCTIAAALAMTAVSCVDNNYDLSDIDTTTRITVNDLVLPVNIDAITLDDLFDLKEDSKIKRLTIDGKEFYALSETGTFSSNEIFIERITADAPVLEPTSRTLQQVVDEQPSARRHAPAKSADARTYEIVDMGNEFDYNAGSVDEAIVEARAVSVDPMMFTIDLVTHDTEECAQTIIFTDLVIEMPKGLTATASHGEYNPATGLWTIASHSVDGTTTSATLTVTAIDFAANGCNVTPQHTLNYKGDFKVRSGLLTIEPKHVNGQPVPLPLTLEFSARYTLSELVANSFSGVINYKLQDMTIAPISISDIPDFLNGGETDLLLENPQIYLNFNNPVADNHLTYTTGLTFTPVHPDWASTPYSPAHDISVGYDRGVGPYNFVLAPENAGLWVPPGYEAAPEYIAFPSLGKILAAPEGSAVKGLPSKIEITVEDPQLPTQPVEDFLLGRNIPAVTGKYDFMAPLALADGSLIVYTDTQDGWNDEDVDAIVISRLSASMTVTNNAPLEAELAAYPIDVTGHRIPGVEVRSTTLPAGCTDQPLTIDMTGVITHLDGIEFEARMKSNGSGTPLSPSQTITIKNLRARVTGYYEKEL